MAYRRGLGRLITDPSYGGADLAAGEGARRVRRRQLGRTSRSSDLMCRKPRFDVLEVLAGGDHPGTAEFVRDQQGVSDVELDKLVVRHTGRQGLAVRSVSRGVKGLETAHGGLAGRSWSTANRATAVVSGSTRKAGLVGFAGALLIALYVIRRSARRCGEWLSDDEWTMLGWNA